MKVIVLAAGRSKRLKPLSDKVLLSFLGKTLIEHQLNQLSEVGLADVIIVGGAHNIEVLQELTNNLSNKIIVTEQKDLNAGMAGAVLSTEKFLKHDPVLVISANDVVDETAYRDIIRISKDTSLDGCLIGKKVTSYFPGGYLKVDEKGLLESIIEKPGEGNEPSDVINLVVHYHADGTKLIENLRQTKSDSDSLYETTIDKMIKAGAKIKVVPYEGPWYPIKYPWHVFDVAAYYFSKGKKYISKNAHISDKAIIKGDVIIEDGVKVFENAIIRGPAYLGKNTVVANNALVRDSYVGEDCVVGFSTEIARSFLGNNVWTHANYIGDSIIGNNCSFGSGAVTGNLRIDEKNISVNISDNKIDSGRNKLGLIMGDNVRCGINTSFMPGIKIGNNCFIGAGIIVGQDIEDNMFVYGKVELIVKENTAELDSNLRAQMKRALK
ncbi:MAG: sugar phosphate nucleotidyltransferase [bacterium]